MVRIFLHNNLINQEEENIKSIILFFSILGFIFIICLIPRIILLSKIIQYVYYTISMILFIIFSMKLLFIIFESNEEKYYSDFFYDYIDITLFTCNFLTIFIKYFIYRYVQKYIILLEKSEESKRLEDKDEFFEQLEKRVEKGGDRWSKDFNNSFSSNERKGSILSEQEVDLQISDSNIKTDSKGNISKDSKN